MAYPPSPPPPPAPPMPYPRPAPADDRRAAWQMMPWAIAVLLGSLILVVARVMALSKAADESDGIEVPMLVLNLLGGSLMGLALVAGGCFASRVAVGARVAMLGIGAYLLTMAASPLPFFRYY